MPIMTAADDKFYDMFLNFWKKSGMIFHEKCLPADNSHEISCLICYPPTKSEGYSFGRDIVSASSIRPSIPSALFVCPEPYLSTYWSDLIHSWYK